MAKFTPSEVISLQVPASSLHRAAIWIFASEWPVAEYWFLQHPSIWFMFAPKNSLWQNSHAPSCSRGTQRQQVRILFKVLLAPKSMCFKLKGLKTACVFCGWLGLYNWLHLFRDVSPIVNLKGHPDITYIFSSAVWYEVQPIPKLYHGAITAAITVIYSNEAWKRDVL